MFLIKFIRQKQNNHKPFLDLDLHLDLDLDFICHCYREHVNEQQNCM